MPKGMQVVKEPISACEISLQIEVEPEKVSAAVDQAYREFARYISVPGFRKGKAPLSFVRPRVPESQLRERTAELLVEPAYQEALKKEEVHPFAAPKLELVTLQTPPADPKFQFKALVPLPPQVALGPYAGVAIERKRVQVTDQEVDERLQTLRDRAAEYPLVEDRSAKTGDVLVTELAITPEGDAQGEPRPTIIHLGDADNIPGLDKELLGLSTGKEKTFTLTYPADYPNDEVAGRKAQFHVKVNELHERKLPALDAEFAKKAGGVDTVEALRQSLRTELEKFYLEMAEREMEAELIDKIVASSKIEYPTVLREAEVDGEVREFLANLERQGTTLEGYLEQSQQTRESLSQSFETRADRRIRRGLVLGEIASSEKLLVADDDVEKEIAQRADAQRTTPAAMRAYIEANKETEAVRNAAQTKKVLGFLTAAAIISDKSARKEDKGAAKKKPQASSKEKSKAVEQKPKAKSAKASKAKE